VRGIALCGAIEDGVVGGETGGGATGGTRFGGSGGGPELLVGLTTSRSPVGGSMSGVRSFGGSLCEPVVGGGGIF
jgi:hypothetical protein